MVTDEMHLSGTIGATTAYLKSSWTVRMLLVGYVSNKL